MTLEEITKIEILSLKLIDYHIEQPNPIYYLELLYKNIFISNKCKNMDYLSKLNISFLKSIMCFSNNYLKYHPFYLSCFIIKYCYEKNKIDGFQKTLIDYFDMNMRAFRNNYEEFLKSNDSQMKIALIHEKKKKDEGKSQLYRKAEINNEIIKKIKNFERFKSTNKLNIYNSTINKSCKKETNANFKQTNNYFINIAINPMNNIYYKKFIDNFISESSKEKLSDNFHQNFKTLDASRDKITKINKLYKHKIKFNNKNYAIESPKKFGILINYRYKKKIPEKTKHINNNKLVFFNLRKNIQKNDSARNSNQKDINDENLNEKKNEENQENKENNIINLRENNNKRFNFELNSNSFKEYCYSIRKNYKNKSIRNFDKVNNNAFGDYNVNYTANFKLLNNKDMCQKKEGRNINIKSYLEKDKNYKSFHDNKYNIDDSHLMNTINQSESSFSNKNKERNIGSKRVHKVRIRNFYKLKNSILLNFSNSETKQILIK